MPALWRSRARRTAGPAPMMPTVVTTWAFPSETFELFGCVVRVVNFISLSCAESARGSADVNGLRGRRTRGRLPRAWRPAVSGRASRPGGGACRSWASPFGASAAEDGVDSARACAGRSRGRRSGSGRPADGGCRRVGGGGRSRGERLGAETTNQRIGAGQGLQWVQLLLVASLRFTAFRRVCSPLMATIWKDSATERQVGGAARRDRVGLVAHGGGVHLAELPDGERVLLVVRRERATNTWSDATPTLVAPRSRLCWARLSPHGRHRWRTPRRGTARRVNGVEVRGFRWLFRDLPQRWISTVAGRALGGGPAGVLRKPPVNRWPAPGTNSRWVRAGCFPTGSGTRAGPGGACSEPGDDGSAAADVSWAGDAGRGGAPGRRARRRRGRRR